MSRSALLDAPGHHLRGRQPFGPRDLISLSKTSKALCRTLYSPNASSLWKAARNAAGAPDCSPGLSEPQWASLIFGRPICQQCDTTNIHNIEFGVRRRVCIPCKKQNLVPAVKFEKVFPDYDASIMDMIPYTRSGGWRPRRSPQSPGKFFWASDVERIASEWAALQRDIHMYARGARAKAAAYRKQRIDEAARIAEHADICDEWLRQVSWKARTEARDKQMARFTEIQERLLALGYDDQDIHYSAFERPSFQKDVEFTDQFWAHIRPKVVLLVESRRDGRLERERAVLRLQRITILQPLYREYAKSLVPMQWCYLPNIYELADFPAVKDIVDADSSITVSSSSFQPVIAQLPTLIPEWISAKRARIISMLEPPPPGTVDPDDPLNLATSVFECISNSCHRGSSWWSGRPKQALISWEAIAGHSCQVTNNFVSASHNPTNLGISRLGANTASLLVRAAGLDPLSATAAEMDALDLRFACLECPLLVPQFRSKAGYPWKSAVEHGMTTEHAQWYKMSTEEAQRIKQNERDTSGNQSAWTCNHCADHFNNWRSKQAVNQHLYEIHQITSPKEPSDLFWYPEHHRTPPALLLASTEIAIPTHLDVV
ncbi:hypothetical protein BD779DRAFT_1171205 [Infundibulicybe gibba]|nr:hypothetical protein BD779DRAFT_1171205 [Infundibulicybe gibba]